MDTFFAWLTEHPTLALSDALVAAAAVESIFPFLPAETAVAFGGAR
ncbi:MAG: hypothetical protein M3081_00470 [Gemmatimonadota bacterium]|nr:hypothetical protein [Gemmatimonadota bacterium]